MNVAGFAIFCVFGFLAPIPLLAWLDRPRRPGSPPPLPTKPDPIKQ
jgi:hypothetical protein